MDVSASPCETSAATAGMAAMDEQLYFIVAGCGPQTDIITQFSVLDCNEMYSSVELFTYTSVFNAALFTSLP
jgi:hypothetical protein